MLKGDSYSYRCFHFAAWVWSCGAISRYYGSAKFDHYRSIESLQAYVLIAQDKPQGELFQRLTNNWLLSVAKGLEACVRLETIDCELVLAEVYERVL